jgi:putative colanic acid biosynthesis UDP-glucose lipid carrier transferase
VAFSRDFDNRLVTYLCWYLLTSVGMVVCRSLIRYGAGWLRNRGYNRRLCCRGG